MFKLIFKTIEQIFDLVWYVIKTLHLQMLVFFGGLGLLINAFNRVIVLGSPFFVIFHIIIALCVIFAVVATVMSVKNYFSGGEKAEQPKREQSPSPSAQPKFDAVQNENSAETEGVDDNRYVRQTPTPKREKPNYYRVSQNPKYVMAEYSDRYELYFDGADGLKYVRTDYKKEA